MHFEGRELISRGTKASARTLTTACFAKFLLAFSGAEGPAKIAGLEIPLDQLNTTGTYLIAFLTAAHLQSWWGDRLSYQRWNVTDRVSPNNLGSSGSLLSKLDGTIRDMQTAITKFDVPDESLVQSVKLKEIKQQLDWTKSTVQDIRHGIDNLNTYAKAVLYGWYLFVPLTLAALAIFIPDLLAQLHSTAEAPTTPES